MNITPNIQRGKLSKNRSEINFLELKLFFPIFLELFATLPAAAVEKHTMAMHALQLMAVVNKVATKRKKSGMSGSFSQHHNYFILLLYVPIGIHFSQASKSAIFLFILYSSISLILTCFLPFYLFYSFLSSLFFHPFSTITSSLYLFIIFPLKVSSSE